MAEREPQRGVCTRRDPHIGFGVRCSVDYDQIRRTDQIVDPLRRAPARQCRKIKTDRLGSELPIDVSGTASAGNL